MTGRTLKPDVKIRIPENIGVINPYALAEVQLNKKVKWGEVDVQKTLSEALHTPYEQLFDPKFESPLYTGLKLDLKTQMMQKAPLQPAVLGAPALAAGPAAVNWIDPGDFFHVATEMTDPVQGALGDCYYIAALASVAWATTYKIAQRTRHTSMEETAFVDMIEFYGNGTPTQVEVTELLPMNPPANTWIYARSSDPQEIWPAVYEKAYAKWRTHAAGDQPDYNPIAGGDPVGACKQLTGWRPHYRWNSDLTADAIWQYIRQNCISRKTFHPMVAWTYASGDASPDHVNYNNAHLVANHAYSILGWNFANNLRYVVLRNPWGSYEATLNVLGGVWMAYDPPARGKPGFWRSINLGANDGIFALRLETFKSFFSGFGWVEG
jgi:hypothetical protein